MTEKKQNTAKWLRILFCIQLVGCLLAALALFGTLIVYGFGSWYNLVLQAVSLGVTVCLFFLPKRYRFSGICKVACIALGLWPMLLHKVLMPAMGGSPDYETIQLWTTAINRTATVLGFGALILEYIAHAALVPAEKKKWYFFLAFSMAISLLSNAAVSYLNPMLQELSAEAIWHWNIAARSVNLAIQAVYLILLARTISIFKKEEYPYG